MIETLAVVINELDNGTVECLKGAGGLCGSCREKSDNCVPEVFNKSKEVIFKVKNTHNAKLEDVVRIGVPAKSVLLSALVAYGVPLLGLVIGAVIGHFFDKESQIFSMIGSLIGLIVAAIIALLVARIFVNYFWAPKMLGVLPKRFVCQTRQKEEMQPIGKTIE